MRGRVLRQLHRIRAMTTESVTWTKVTRADGSHPFYLVDHDPEWIKAQLPINAAGDTVPGWECVHKMENGTGRCGGNTTKLLKLSLRHTCVVEYPRERLTRMHRQYAQRH